jgi:hypothetical protein
MKVALSVTMKSLFGLSADSESMSALGIAGFGGFFSGTRLDGVVVR